MLSIYILGFTDSSSNSSSECKDQKQECNGMKKNEIVQMCRTEETQKHCPWSCKVCKCEDSEECIPEQATKGNCKIGKNKDCPKTCGTCGPGE